VLANTSHKTTMHKRLQYDDITEDVALHKGRKQHMNAHENVHSTKLKIF